MLRRTVPEAGACRTAKPPHEALWARRTKDGDVVRRPAGPPGRRPGEAAGRD
ncbi:hypothetical protein AB0395_41400 [Streptosporangium sp. NPDC051023]|uniref:hypothetical protein n=1 Tax=Streptosporangium sp. NPDC051023 TaxID=3155410 RepID=UPI00344BA627